MIVDGGGGRVAVVRKATEGERRQARKMMIFMLSQ